MAKSPYHQMSQQHILRRQQDNNHQWSNHNHYHSWEAEIRLEAHIQQQALLGVQQLELQRMGRDQE